MRKLIRTDGTSEDLPEPVSIKQASALINADCLDTVALRHLGRPLQVMLVDDRGHEKGLPVNAEATALYLANCIVGTTHQIRGDVVVVPDEDFAFTD
jgi:hypothetical protein